MAELLQIIPANEIEKYLIKQRNDAAILIQASYRGYRQRKFFNRDKINAERYKAAVCIQRAVS